MMKDKMVKNAVWAKTQVGAMKVAYATTMAYLMANSPVFAAGVSSDTIAKKIRKFIFPFYVLVVGALCIMSWLKGQTAVAAISLAVGILFGVILFYPTFVKSILETIAGWFGATGFEG